MSGERMRAATFGDFVLTGPTFMEWVDKTFAAILVREDYWAPEIFEWPGILKVPNFAIDRNEILLVPRRAIGLAVSISWTMPLVVSGLGGDRPGLVMMRGHANCLTCQHREGYPGAGICTIVGKVSAFDGYRRDLGGCPNFVAAPPGDLPLHRAPVWWRDTDWVLAPYRYSPDCFMWPAIEAAIQGHEVTTPLRFSVIPPSLREQASGEISPRLEPPTKETWIGFIENRFAGQAGLDEFVAEARKRDYVPCGV